jgi:transketolase
VTSVPIEGHTDLSFSDDVATRFLAYGWNVHRVGDVNDLQRLNQAIEIFHRNKDVPTLIIVESHIGYGAPHKHDTSAAHGEPLGEEEVRLAELTKFGFTPDKVIAAAKDQIAKSQRLNS